MEQKQRPHCHQWQEAYCTAAYCSIFVGLSMQTSLLGPTLGGLAVSYGEVVEASAGSAANHTTTGGAFALSESLMGRGIGYYIGTMFIGVVFDRFATHAHVLFFMCCCMCCVGTAFIPLYPLWSKGDDKYATTGSNVGIGRWYLFLALMFQGMAGGAVDLGGNVLLTRLFQDRLESLSPRMNLLHCMWGVGATLGPLLAVGLGLKSTSLPLTYGVVSLLAVLLSLPVLFLPSPSVVSCKKINQQEMTAEAEVAEVTEVTEVTQQVTSSPCACTAPVARILFLMMMFYFTYAGAERIMGDWIATFATLSPAGATTEAGAVLVSVYFGSMSIGRLLSAMATAKPAWARILSPTRLITGDVSVALLSWLLLLFVGSYSFSWMVVSVAGVGLAFSSVYPMGVAFAESKMKASGSQQSIFLSGAPLGGIIWPTIIGTLMREQSILYFPYAGTLMIGLCGLVFCFVFCSPSTYGGGGEGGDAREEDAEVQIDTAGGCDSVILL